MISFLKNRINSVKFLVMLYWLVYTKIYECFFSKLDNFTIEKRDLLIKELNIYYNYSNYKVKENFYKILFVENFSFVDVVWARLFSLKYKTYNGINLFRSYFRVLHTNQGFYFNFNDLHNKNNFLNTLKFTFLSGLKSIWVGLKFWIISLTVGFSIVYYSMVIRCLPFSKTLFVWISFLMFSYWLISGFVFFIKKYQFGKYTTAVQRFWRRSFILFWLLEFGLFLIYLYLTLNANTESFYMFDQIQVFKTHFFSWRSFLLKVFPLTLLLIIGYLFLLTIKWNILNKHIAWLIILTIILTYIVWIEFYQFFHVINYYGNFNWIYDVDERVWSLELEPRKTRTVNHYAMLMTILKFWHIVFIFGFWVFFVLRSMELGRIRYPLLSANLQNFVILYVFGWIVMYPWLKFLFRRYLDMPYYWFYVNNRELGLRVFFNDITLVYYGIIDFFSITFTNFFFDYDFFYWSLSNSDVNFSSYRKSVLKNLIINCLNK